MPLASRLFVCLLLLALGSPVWAASLRSTLGSASELVGISGGTAFDALARVIANTAARSIPVISASAGFTYRYNPDLDVFERSSQTLGPVFLERPDTLGRNKINVNVSYQFVQFDEYDGEDLSDLEAPDPIVLKDVTGGTVVGLTATRLRYRLGVRNHIAALSVTYGVLDELDVNLLLPLLATTFDVGVTARTIATAGPDGVFAPAPGAPTTGRTDDRAVGVGDLLARFKYRLPDRGRLRSAASLQFRIPSGDEDEFQGTGDFEVSPGVSAGAVLWDRVSTYGNLVVDLNASDVSRSQFRWGLGADIDVTPRFNVALAFLARHEIDAPVDSGETDFLHLTPAGLVDRPLLGIDFDRSDYYDLSFGARLVVWRDIMVFANGIVALNDSGLRNGTVIPTIGLEGTF